MTITKRQFLSFLGAAAAAGISRSSLMSTASETVLSKMPVAYQAICLPAAQIGTTIKIVNRGLNPLTVYAPNGDAGVSLVGKSVASFVLEKGAWKLETLVDCLSDSADSVAETPGSMKH